MAQKILKFFNWILIICCFIKIGSSFENSTTIEPVTEEILLQNVNVSESIPNVRQNRIQDLALENLRPIEKEDEPLPPPPPPTAPPKPPTTTPRNINLTEILTFPVFGNSFPSILGLFRNFTRNSILIQSLNASINKTISNFELPSIPGFRTKTTTTTPTPTTRRSIRIKPKPNSNINATAWDHHYFLVTLGPVINRPTFRPTVRPSNSAGGNVAAVPDKSVPERPQPPVPAAALPKVQAPAQSQQVIQASTTTKAPIPISPSASVTTEVQTTPKPAPAPLPQTHQDLEAHKIPISSIQRPKTGTTTTTTTTTTEVTVPPSDRQTEESIVTSTKFKDIVGVFAEFA